MLVIMSDEHTRSVMGAYGNSIVQTPTLDKLANDGVRFKNAYTPSPICVSARASFATGTQVHENKCWSSAQPYYGQQQSWMHRVRDQGSEVVSIGKLHYRSAADDLGFCEEILPMYLANEGKGWPQGLLRKPLPSYPAAAELAAGIGPGETSYTQYDRNITAASIEWLKKKGRDKREKSDQDNNENDQPWVLFVSFICPHYPLSAPQKFYDLYREVELPKPYDTSFDAQLKHPVMDVVKQFWNYDEYFDDAARVEGLRNYYGLCSFLDDNVCQLLNALDESGEKSNTQIIYTSDHGDLLGNHGMWCKSCMYEDSVGIPLTLTGPGITPGVIETPVSLTDIASTITSFVSGEVEPVPKQQWRSQPLHTVTDSAKTERVILSEYHDGGSPCGIFMIRKGRWKYVYFAEHNSPLLFDMDADPQEQNNLVDDVSHQNTRENLHAALLSILDPEQVNNEAFGDQQTVIEAYGGLQAIKDMASFNHTPVE